MTTNILYKDLSYQIMGAAFEVHGQLRPGFLEAVYENALAIELNLRGIPFEQQVHLPVKYKGRLVGNYVADIVVDNKVILELKVVSSLNDAHKAQAINYLAATGLKLAILMNFAQRSLQHSRVISKRNI